MPRTKIEWTRGADGSDGYTWNPVVGCTKVSQGCKFCYAKTIHDMRHQAYLDGKAVAPQYAQPFETVQLMPDRLTWPLSLRKPSRIFVNSVSDLFHEDVPDEFIDQVFAVMAIAERHQFQILTKRPERMCDYLGHPDTPGRVLRAADAFVVAREIARMGPERLRSVDGFLGYYVSDRGHVYTESGSESCLRCGAPFEEAATAKRRYCSTKCRSADDYDRRMGRLGERPPASPARMSPDVGDDGHQRVMLYSDGAVHRALVHRLVLQQFVGIGGPDAQGCHRDGDPTNNALPNLRWGNQSANWDDRKRHGNQQSFTVLSLQQVQEIRGFLAAKMSRPAVATRFGISETQVRNIEQGKQWAERTDWPLKNCWVGVSVENQEVADERIPLLLQTPAAIRFLSCEPLLGPVDLLRTQRVGQHHDWLTGERESAREKTTTSRIDWVIVGGESGSSKQNPRPMHPEWARSLRDQCVAAGVPFLFKLWGDWRRWTPGDAGEVRHVSARDGRSGTQPGLVDGERHLRADTVPMVRVGKKRAGRVLDGRTWDEYPAVQR